MKDQIIATITGVEVIDKPSNYVQFDETKLISVSLRKRKSSIVILEEDTKIAIITCETDDGRIIKYASTNIDVAKRLLGKAIEMYI